VAVSVPAARSRWARLAVANLEHAAAQGAIGHGEIICGDVRAADADQPAPAS
jgi:hypothetical protein